MAEACGALDGGEGGESLASELASLPVVLLMEYVPGAGLMDSPEAFAVRPDPRLDGGGNAPAPC